MKAVYALYAGPDAAQRAVDALGRRGAADRDIVVMSSEPFEEYEFSHRDKATWLHWIAGGGGVAGLLAGYLLTTITQQLRGRSRPAACRSCRPGRTSSSSSS